MHALNSGYLGLHLADRRENWWAVFLCHCSPRTAAPAPGKFWGSRGARYHVLCGDHTATILGCTGLVNIAMGAQGTVNIKYDTCTHMLSCLLTAKVLCTLQTLSRQCACAPYTCTVTHTPLLPSSLPNRDQVEKRHWESNPTTGLLWSEPEQSQTCPGCLTSEVEWVVIRV